MKTIIRTLLDAVGGAVGMYIFIALFVLPPAADRQAAEINAIELEWRVYSKTQTLEIARRDSVILALQKEIIRLESRYRTACGGMADLTP